MIAGRNSGRITRRNVVKVRARSISDASSRLRSIWLIAAMPARTPTGMLRKTKQTTRISPVPVSSIGGTLKARIYDTPTTVPGIAKLSIVANSKARWPANRQRDKR